MPILTTFIQHYKGSYSQYNKVREVSEKSIQIGKEGLEQSCLQKCYIQKILKDPLKKSLGLVNSMELQDTQSTYKIDCV